jgi:hypothetical protein
VLLLTPTELRDLTGYKRAGDQSRWLAQNRVPHALNAAGKPVVSRAAVEAFLGAPVASAGAPEPNWSAIGA